MDDLRSRMFLDAEEINHKCDRVQAKYENLPLFRPGLFTFF